MVLQFNLEMSMRVQDLIGADLDRAVAKAENLPPPYYDAANTAARYSSRWEIGGPIIEREGITIQRVTDSLWDAFVHRVHHADGPTPLVAAMRCFVASKLGDEI